MPYAVSYLSRMMTVYYSINLSFKLIIQSTKSNITNKIRYYQNGSISKEYRYKYTFRIKYLHLHIDLH